MIRYMLDTDTCIYVINNRPPEIRTAFSENAEQLSISAITLAELRHGAEKSKHPVQSRRRVEDFILRLQVLEYGRKAAIHYGDIKAGLEQKGALIGPNDLFIASHARSESLILVTNNLSEFRRVQGLLVENWLNR